MLLPKLEKDDNEEHEELSSISTISISWGTWFFCALLEIEGSFLFFGLFKDLGENGVEIEEGDMCLF